MAVRRNFPPRTLAWVVGGAAASFILAILFTAFSDDLGGPVSTGTDTFSFSALGHRAFYTFLEESGKVVIRRRSERITPPPSGALLVAAEPRVDPDDGTADRERFTLLMSRAWVSESRLMVVLPKRTGIGDPANLRWLADVQPAGIEASQDVLNLLQWGDEDSRYEVQQLDGKRKTSCTTSWGEEFKISITDLQLLKPSDSFESVILCEEGILVARHEPQEGPSGIYVLSDPDIINNHGLGRADHAVLAHALITREIDPTLIMFDESIHGFTRGEGVLLELLTFPLNLATAHGVLLLILLLWSGMRRFGQARPVVHALSGGKMTLIETTASLMETRMPPSGTLPEYFRQTLRSVAAHYMLPTDLSQAGVIARLRRLSQARSVEEDIGKLREEIGRVGKGRVRSGRALEIARRLHKWRMGMLDVS